MLAWDQFIGSDNVGRVPIERKLARVPAPRVFPREPKSLLQANIKIDHRSQITDHRTKRKGTKRKRERECEQRMRKEKEREKERKRERETEHF